MASSITLRQLTIEYTVHFLRVTDCLNIHSSEWIAYTNSFLYTRHCIAMTRKVSD